MLIDSNQHFDQPRVLTHDFDRIGRSHAKAQVYDNTFQTVSLLDLEAEQIELNWARYGIPDHDTSRKLAERGGLSN